MVTLLKGMRFLSVENREVPVPDIIIDTDQINIFRTNFISKAADEITVLNTKES